MNNPILNLIKSIEFGFIFGIISIYLIGIFFPSGEGTEIFIDLLKDKNIQVKTIWKDNNIKFIT
ncbi:MAG: hypothetical protein NSGCLCUN01_00028 [uncultured Clostridium sp.]